MSSHYREQLDYPEGSIEIHFNLDFDGITTSVQNLQVNSNKGFETGIPNSPTLEWHDNKWMLGAHRQVKENNHIVDCVEYLNNKWSNEIVDLIMNIKAAATPKFSP